MSQRTYLSNMINIMVRMSKICTGNERYSIYINSVIYIKSAIFFLPNNGMRQQFKQLYKGHKNVLSL